MVDTTVATTASGSVQRDRSARNTLVIVVFTAITNLADGVTKVALPLMATRLTHSPLAISAVSLTLTLPWLLAALHVGVLVDRFDRRMLLWLANVMRVLAVGGLLVAVAERATTLPVLYVGGLVLGVAEVVALTSAAAIVPSAVGPKGLERANALVAGAETVCNEFCGPFVGGLLVAIGAGVALGTTAVGYLVAIVVLGLLAGRFRARAGGERPTATVHQQIVEGLHYLLRQRMLRLMALVLTVLCGCWGAWLAIMPLVATSLMHLDAHGYGILLSALGVGGLVGALTVSTVNRLLGRRWAMFADLIGTLAMVATPALVTNIWAVAVAAFLGGLGGTLWTVNSRTISQRLVETEMMGRYSAAAKLFSWGAMPLGAAVVGVLAELVGPRAALLVFAVATAALIVPFLRTFTSGVVTGSSTD